MKQFPYSAFLAALWLPLAVESSPPTQAPTGGLVENSGLVAYPGSSQGDILLSWWAYDGHYYFIQHSEDLVNWTYLPMYDEGFESALTWGFQVTADRQFWRLHYSDDPSSDLLSADFSGTGVSNWMELQFGLDPFVPTDSDGSGLPDAWQLYHFGRLGIDPLVDADGDGSTNLQEYQAGTDPRDYWDRPGGSPNLAPSVSVPDDKILVWPNDTVSLAATAHDPDDGPSPLSYTWEVVSGPTGATFGDATLLETDAVFPSSGIWILRFSADDGETSTSASVAVNVIDDPDTLPQEVRFVSPADGAWVEQGESLLLWVKSDEAVDPVTEIEIFRDGVSILQFAEDLLNMPTSWSDNFTEGGFGYVTYEAVATHLSGLTTTSKITVFCSPLGTPPPGGGGGGGGGGGSGPGGPVSGNVVGSVVAAPLPSEGPLGLSQTDHSVTTWDQDVVEAEEELQGDPGQVMLIEVVVDSAEYDHYTGEGSEFNDTVFWSITPSWGSGAVSGSHSVNELHSRFGEGDGTAIVGIFAVTFPFDGDPDAEPHVTLKGSVQNISDGALDTSVSFRSTTVDIVPDYDRDGFVREEDAVVNGETRLSDYNRARSREIFHFWRNDDNDDSGSEVDGEDTPGQSGGGDGRENTIQGTRDLVDYFPVFIDLQDFLQGVDLADVRIHLVQPGLNFVEPQTVLPQGWTPAQADQYLRDPPTARTFTSAQKQEARASNPLSPEFLEEIKSGRGILLFDGRASSTDDLRLVLQYKGNQLLDLRLPLRISPVEEMYRRVNLAHVIQGSSQSTPTATGDPQGWPDAYTTDRYFAFLHGFNVSQQQARGWNSQMFKRLFWSGSQARYVGVTWHGDTGPNYYRAVRNAFLTGEHLAGALGFLPSDDLVISAHSLGNMVVSSAIRPPRVQHDPDLDGPFAWQPDQYFLLNAAVPIEAYDSSQTHGTGGSGSMWSNIRNPDWTINGHDYHDRLTASFFFDLFSEGKPDADGNPVYDDDRQYLTWQGRFSGIDFATNFYSTGEDVLRNASGSKPAVTEPIFEGGASAWTYQEMVKGTGLAGNVSLNPVHGGWGISFAPQYLGPLLTPLHPDEMNATDAEGAWVFTDGELRLTPFFKPFNGAGDPPIYDGHALFAPIGDSAAKAQARLPATQYKLLAEAIPAASFAAGANAVDAFTTDPASPKNINMQDEHQTSGEWPAERPVAPDGSRPWLHSDLKNVAYPYVYSLFDEIVKQGGLK